MVSPYLVKQKIGTVQVGQRQTEVQLLGYKVSLKRKVHHFCVLDTNSEKAHPT